MRMPLVSLAGRLPLLALAALLAAASPASAQQAPADPTAPPTITFTFDFPQSRPEHAVVTVDATGRARYQSSGPLFADSSDADPHSADFTMSDATRERIFALAAQLNYFHGEFDYRKHRIAFTGKKTLEYVAAGNRSSTSYNWSEDPAVRELTGIFQDIVNTQESARRLLFLRRFDRLGLDAELKSMEEMAKSNALGELQSIAPLLRQIADDSSVVHVARERALRLWERSQPAASLTAAPQ
ncbi:MAG TPA: hypothetical protein VE825_08345 [Terriglobales bacterium]|jgi:hypothetical protein|nr:hypothetical protein [Terriglobales bacterium]